MQRIPAAQFKAQCLAVMDQVSQSGQPVIGANSATAYILQ
jgi:hypothetical protein